MRRSRYSRGPKRARKRTKPHSTEEYMGTSEFLFEATGLTWIGRQHESFDQSLTDHASRRQPTTIKVVSKIAASDTIRVIAGQEFSLRRTSPAKGTARIQSDHGASECGDAIGRPRRGRHVESLDGIRRAETHSPQPQPAERSDSRRRSASMGDSLLDCGGRLARLPRPHNPKQLRVHPRASCGLA